MCYVHNLICRKLLFHLQVKNIPPPWGVCGSQHLAYFDTYDSHNCQRECEINRTISICECLQYYMPASSITEGKERVTSLPVDINQSDLLIIHY